MCVNIKALVSEINQITLKSCYKKVSTRKFTYFLCLWCCECGQWREFNSISYVIYTLVYTLFSSSLGCGISFAIEKAFRSSASSWSSSSRSDSRFFSRFMSEHTIECEQVSEQQRYDSKSKRLMSLLFGCIFFHSSPRFFLSSFHWLRPFYSFNSFRISSREQTECAMERERGRETNET